jgi:phi13 family phage major tail protein
MGTNKIKFGIKSCYYATVTSTSTDGSFTYATTPVAIPGAVSISLDAQGEREPFYADNVEYWVSPGNDGYSGNLEVAYIPDSFRADVLNEQNDANDVSYEDATAEVKHFALMFQFEGDDHATRHVFYNCTAGRPTINGNTKEATISPQTETIPITAKSVFIPGIGANGKDVVKARTNASTNSTAYANWFSSVYTVTTTTAV